MKKFTGKSLLGELSITRILRKVGVSLMVVLWTMAVFSQEPQTTLEVAVQNLNNACYADEAGYYYSPQVTIRDFMRLKKFELVLEFKETVFDFYGLDWSGTAAGVTAAGLNSSTVTATKTAHPTDATLSRVKIAWETSGDPVSIYPDNTILNFFKLRFRVDGYPHTYGTNPAPPTVFSSDLAWNHDLSKYWNQQGQVVQVLTDWTTNGNLTVTQQYADITLDKAPADCSGGQALVTVTSPLTGYYSFNGTSYTNNPSTLVTAPTGLVNTVRVKSTTSSSSPNCISFYKMFDVSSNPLLTFTASNANINCPPPVQDAVVLGDIEIKVDGTNTGKAPYTYYVVPSANWPIVSAGLTATGTTNDQAKALLLPFRIFTGYGPVAVVQRPVGTYYIAVQDANECKDLKEAWNTSTWKSVTVSVVKQPWDVPIVKTDVTCCGQNDGRAVIGPITGGTPFAGGKYHLWFNDVYKGKVSTWDSGSVLAGSTPTSSSSGITYSIIVRDSLACQITKTVTIAQPAAISFQVNHQDASCSLPNGKIWIVAGSISGGTGSTASYTWQITTDPSWATSGFTQTSTSYAFENLPRGVYYARVFDTRGCNAQYLNPNSDNAIKVLGIDFDVVYSNILCYGGTTTATVVLLTGDANHTFKFSKDGGETWVSNPVFAGITATQTTFGVWDQTIDCKNYWTKTVVQPPRIDISLLDATMLPPTCPGNADGNLVVKIDDINKGTPFTTGSISYYKYRMDNQPWVQNSNYNTFAVDLGRHTILVEDKNGCRDTIGIDLADMVNKINFTNKIYNNCKLDTKNLLDPAITDTVKWWGPSLESNGYLEDFKWFSVANNRTTFQGNVTGFDYQVWTTESPTWTSGSVVGLNQKRNPVLYISKQYTSAADIATYGTVVGPHIKYGAGTYYVVAKDRYGCYSNTDTIYIIDPPALQIAVTKTNAGCAAAWDGSINITAYTYRNKAWKNDYNLSPGPPIVRYQYVLTQSLAVIEGTGWYDNAPWTNFTNGNYPANDSLAVINVPKGRYWVAVRDYCSKQQPELIQKYGPIDIEGYDPVTASVAVTKVTCRIYGRDPEATGAITVTAGGGAGSGSYTYKLERSGMTTLTNSTGVFTGLYAGGYTLTVYSGSQNCQVVKSVTVTEPYPLRLQLDSIHVSCFNEYDGLLRYTITGGNAPYLETTNNVGIYENVANIPIERWFTVTNTTTISDGVMFDRRVKAGTYEVYVKDAKGCIYGPVKKVIKQPAALQATLTKTDVSCAPAASTSPVTILNSGSVQNDGTITLSLTGGWNGVEDGFKYYIRLLNSAGNTVYKTERDVLESITFTGLTAGAYKVRVYEWKSSNCINTGNEETPVSYCYPNPYINHGNYFTYWNLLSKWQNPDTTAIGCSKKEWSITVGTPAPITYAPTVFTAVTCANTATGQISVTGIQGGVPSTTDGYYVGLEGPCSYTPASGWISTSSSGGSSTCTTVYWFKTGAGANSKLFTGLTWGHYTIHIKDSKNCWIYKESGEINNRDELKMQMLLKENVLCYNTATGKISVQANYGSPTGSGQLYPGNNLPVNTFLYAIDTVRAGYGFQLWNDTYINSLNWQASPDFMVKKGVWVGFVKDGNGCRQGGPDDINGNPILAHRIAVVGPDPVTASIYDEVPVTNKVVDGVATKCRTSWDGKIHVLRIQGGNGPKYSAHVWGTSEIGEAVNKWYSDLTGYEQYLGELPGTYTIGQSYTATPTYTVEVFDNTGCTSSPTLYKVAIPRPQQFQIELVWDKQRSFICASDKSAVFTINVLTGGTPFTTDPLDPNKYKYAWDAYKAGVKVDSLSGVKGFVRSFVGYGGLTYKVRAYDKWDCVSDEVTVDIPAPLPIMIQVQDLTCYNASTATAKVTVSGTTDRWYKIWYRQEYINPTWTLWDGGVSGATVTFTSSVIVPLLAFGNVDDTHGHYDFKVEDNFGCTALYENFTFVPVQNPLKITAAVKTPGECTSTIEVTLSGGVPVSQLYSEVWIDNTRYTSIQTGWTISNIAAGTHTLKVVDSHGCEATGSITVASNPYPPRVINLTVNKGETKLVTDAEAGVNESLPEGSKIYNYTYLGCPRVLTVNITAVYPSYAISVVQGQATQATASPYLNKYVSVSGKVTGVKGTEGFWMQDASAAWSGIFVKYSGGGVLEGNGVTVKGKVTEPNNVTTIEADAITLEVSALTITPVEVTAAEASTEPYESVLVKIKEKTRPSNVSPSGWNANATSGNVAVTTNLYAYTPDASHFYVITGIIQGSTTTYVLTPRKASDIVDHSQTTSIDPIDGLEFKVYPNPFNDRIFIDNANKLTRAVVCNIAGQRVIDVEYPGREIRTANLVSGVYVVTLFTEDGIVGTERVIKK